MARLHPFQDLYHFFLIARWRVVIGWLATLYIFTNLAFALLFWLGGDTITNARPGSFFDAFFFSAQTLTTVGYGNLSPHGLYADCLAAMESFLGLLGFAMASGLMFAKFARPTAKVIFTRNALITVRDGMPSLVFRMANGRKSQIFEARVSVVLVKTETTAEGESFRKLYDLPLTRERSPLFAHTWTAIHRIDKASPLYGDTAESLAESQAEIYLTFLGTEATFSQTVHARHTYRLSDIGWNRRFVDILTFDDDGQPHIDYSHFHDITAS